jgi:hypothetical protein
MQAMGEFRTSVVIPERVVAGDFAGWLRDSMAERRMSYRLLALQAGLDHTTIHRLAHGERIPSLTTALALIEVLERPRIWMAKVAE